MTDQSNKKVRVRFAPSPTGSLHVGGMRTALYNFLFAKKHQGKFVLRIEDTDRKRLVAGAQEKLQNTLKLLGIVYDEGPDVGGPFAPYVQSERQALYQQYADELIKTNKAYYCFCPKSRLDEIRKKMQANNQPPKYDRGCFELPAATIQEKLKKKTPYVIRLRVPEGETSFCDMIRGEITIQNCTLDDQVLLKSDGYPTYHLANVVDDHLMEITHVIRGEEWLPSTPKHVILYKAFSWQLPKFAHLPLLLNPDKSKLSKRQGDVAVEDYLDKGYLPEALINFVALLGWHPKDEQEIFLLDDLIKEFSLDRVKKGGAVFDTAKLDWMNSVFIKNLPLAAVAEKIEPYLKSVDYYQPGKYSLEKIAALFSDRLDYFLQIKTRARFLYDLPPYEPSLLVPKKSSAEKTAQALQKGLDIAENFSHAWSGKKLASVFDREREKAGLTRQEMFWPLRIAVSGMKNSPGLFDIMDLVGKDETLKRIRVALEKIAHM